MYRVAALLGPATEADNLGAIEQWVALNLDVPLCLWFSNSTNIPEGLSKDFCTHAVDLPKNVDRYLKVMQDSSEWLPWGLKSGPNMHFFQAMERMAEVHSEHWVLLVEPDTYPLTKLASESVKELIDQYEHAWMIGAAVHPWARFILNAELWSHLNGAALYQVGDRGFQAFLKQVWLPSLLCKLKQDPALAYDCLTSRDIIETLPNHLRKAWQPTLDRFVATSRMINVSNLDLSTAQLARLLNEYLTPESITRMQAHPLMLHAKLASIDLSELRIEIERLRRE